MVFGCSEDITRSVLTQIIVEQEGKDGQSLLPIPGGHLRATVPAMVSQQSLAVTIKSFARSGDPDASSPA
jgi:polyhydroxyalkanoate synthesis regulator protein